jgi:hypothetical protein
MVALTKICSVQAIRFCKLIEKKRSNNSNKNSRQRQIRKAERKYNGQSTFWYVKRFAFLFFFLMHSSSLLGVHCGQKQQQINTEKNEEERRKRKRERRKKEKELVAQGKKPYFLAPSKEKQLDRIAKFEELRAKGKLEQYLAKKRKRRERKDHKHIPWERRPQRPRHSDQS